MLKLYFCDDKQECLNLYFNLAKKGILLHEWDIEMGGSFTNPEELLKNLPSDKDSGLYFLDIELASSITGFELAQKIRQKDPKAFLVFISSHSEWALDAFKYRLEAMDFIVKSLFTDEDIQKRIFSCIQTAYERYAAWNVKDTEILTLKSGKNIRFFPCAKVLYISNSLIPHHITIYTAEEMIDCPGTLAEILVRYSDIFLKCSRSLLVNRNHVEKICLAKKEVILDNKLSLPCSFRCLAELKKMMFQKCCNLFLF